MSNILNNEKQILINLIHLNPYPSYKVMQKKLEKQLRLWAEYGEVNHTCCKTIYENPFDEDLVVKMGKIIHDRGGFTALQANFTVIVDMWRGHESIYLEKLFERVTPEWRS